MFKAVMVVGVAIAALGVSPAMTQAGPPKWAPGHKNSASQYAPGQVKKRFHTTKRYIRGDDWVRVQVEDYIRWGLKPPRNGHDYIRQNGTIYEVVKDTLAIIGAVAVVDALTD